ncbi:MAG: glycosyltransferase family 9 protein [Elainellaceae cyanobacterium]
MRVVAFVPGGISEQILFFPTLDDLKQNYPDAEIDVVVEPRAKVAYRVSKSVNEVLSFDYKDRNSPADWANLLGVVRDGYYDAALCLSPKWGTGLLLWLSGIPTRVGYTESAGKIFLTNTVAYKPNQYQAEYYHDLLQAIGVTSPCPELSLSIPKIDLDWAETEQKRLGVSSYVLIYGTPSQGAKKDENADAYPIEQWQKIIQDFQQRQPDLPLVVVQDAEGQGFVSALAKACPTLKVTKPKDIGKLAAMIAGANLMLCVEGAAMHLAVALQVYTLALLGKSDPEVVLPKSDKFQGIKSATGKLADISPEVVLSKVWGG